MDKISSLGRGIFEVIPPTFQAYGDLLQKSSSRTTNNQIRRETFSYGAQPRQQLDLYTAQSEASSLQNHKNNPILVFVYGGGLVAGDKVLTAIPDDLVYSNLGRFFATELGFDTIIMDYRLLIHGATYPSGGFDVDKVLRWVLDRYQGYSSRDVYLMGNSAGGLHVATWLFGEQFEKTRGLLLNDEIGHVRLAGVVFLGCSQRLDPNGPMKDVLEAYYGPEDRVRVLEPTQLMLYLINTTKPAERSRMPRILSVISEFDPEFIVNSTEEFHHLWIEKGGEGDFVVLKGHNHISPPLSLGTGLAQEEAWGHIVGRWLTSGLP